MDDIYGRVALVTGGSRGIGRACALSLARAGTDIAINYHREQQRAEELADEIRDLGRKAIAIRADLSNAADAAQLVNSAAVRLGPVTIVINNAGIARTQRIEEITEQDWDQVVDTNLKSCFMVTQAALPFMREARWGRIINISSVAAHVGGIIGPHYAASKAGMLGLTHFFANSLVKEGITANAISPALIETDMVTSNPNAKPDRIPVGRFGHVDEVADVVVMLARNGYITGQTIHVNGGWYMT